MECFNKESAFEMLEKRFYKQNFGTASKSEIDFLMFYIYLNLYKKDTVMLSDHKISKELGITKAKVRNLREKMFLQFPKAFNWKASLIEILANEKNLKSENGFIYITVHEPFLLNEFEDIFNENGFVDYVLNKTTLG